MNARFKALRIGLVMAATAAMACVAYGRVFARWQASAAARQAMESLGARQAYEADVTVNGGRGRISVFNVDRPMSTVLDDLAHLFALGKIGWKGGTMAAASVTSGSGVLRLLVLNLGDARRSLVILLDQSLADYRQSSLPPAPQAAAGLPAYPGSDPILLVENHDTGSRVSVSRTGSGPEPVRESMARDMAAAGWIAPLLPAGGSSSGLTVYLKGPDVCCVLVGAAPDGAGSLITLLHKRQAIPYD